MATTCVTEQDEKDCSTIFILNIQKQLSFKRHHSGKGVLGSLGSTAIAGGNAEGLNLNI